MTANAPASATLDLIIPALALTHGFYNKLLEGVGPERFARKAPGVDANHPAFILGHVAFYAARAAADLRADRALAKVSSTEDLYSASALCLDDPDASVYPHMPEAVETFNAVFTAIREDLPSVDPDVLHAPIPDGAPFSGFMPSMASLANFMLVAHPMMHAGQFSTWRRAEGLAPSAMR